MTGRNQKAQKHHYIPRFYLKRWAGGGKGLCEFTYFRGKTLERMTYPAGTGYDQNLYAIPGASQANEMLLEEHFFRLADQFASDALTHLESFSVADMPGQLRSGWSRFIRSLQQRSPARLQWLKDECRKELTARVEALAANYQSLRGPKDPANFEAFKSAMHEAEEVDPSWAKLLQMTVDSRETGSFINGMLWNIMTITTPGLNLLTSDNPVVMSNGIAYVDSSIAVPIGPRKLFVAVNNEESAAKLRGMDPKRIVQWMNDRVVKQSQRFVYSTDERQRRFVANRFAAREPDQLIAQMAQHFRGP